MPLMIGVHSRDQKARDRWISELRTHTASLPEIHVEAWSETQETYQLIFVDAALPQLSEFLGTVNRKGKALFLVVPEGSPAPLELQQGRVDDILIEPFRSLEVLGKLRHYREILMWDEVSRLIENFGELIHRLKEDLQLAERLQKAKLPIRFPEMKDFKPASRYLAGARSGGDYFDLAESANGSQY
jgi:hypothetical protein